LSDKYRTTDIRHHVSRFIRSLKAVRAICSNSSGYVVERPMLAGMSGHGKSDGQMLREKANF